MQNQTNHKIKDEIDSFSFVKTTEPLKGYDLLLELLIEIRYKIQTADSNGAKQINLYNENYHQFMTEISTKLMNAGYKVYFYTGEYNTNRFLKVNW